MLTDRQDRIFEDIVATIREPILVLDSDLKVILASHSFITSFKVTREETLGQFIYDLGNKQWDIPKLRELLETILPEKTAFDNYEVEYDFADIGRRTMLLNARQIEQAMGRERVILLAIEDITERKQIEDGLEETRKELAVIKKAADEAHEFADSVINTVREPLISLDQDLRVVTVSRSFYDFFKVKPEETVGQLIYDLGNKQWDIPELRDLLETILLEKTAFDNYEVEHVFADIGRRTMLLNARQIERAMGKERIILLAIEDITERSHLLAVEKAFIENALNTLQDIFFVFDFQGKFLRWNKTMNTATGYTDKEISLKKAIDFFREDERERVTKTIQKGIEKGSARVEAIVVTKDGRQIPYAFNAAILSDAQNKPVGISGVGRDITEHQKLEAQLLHAQKMEAVGTLAGGIAHDFNNILSVIMGYGGMVMETLEAGSPAKEDMNEVLIAADRAADLTRRLLVFSRKDVFKMMPIDINVTILGLKKMLSRIIKESIEFNIELADIPLTVLADAGQIEQILMNLAVNSNDAMKEGGRLTISTGLQEVDDEYVATYGYGKPGQYALITAADTGHGMDAETQKKIFEPFFTTKGIGEGTGLGLAVSYGIIKQHGGYTNVYSEPGQGTVFKIYLPLIEEAAALGKEKEVAAPVKQGDETVLLAEDDASLRKLATIVLESFGYTVIAAVEGEDAIAKFMENRELIGLVMLDMIMPKKNGKEVGEAIRKVSPGTKILFSSGYPMDKIKEDELLGADADFINKPFTPKDLLVKVREMLDR